MISGANIQQRFIQRGTAYATFFEDYHVAGVLGCPPSEVQSTFAAALRIPEIELRSNLRERSTRFLSRAKKHARADRYEAVQAAAIEWLKDEAGQYQESARIVWHERFESSLRFPHASEAPDIGSWLELKTFFTEIRQRPELCDALWPQPSDSGPLSTFRNQELRAQLLSSAARLGHSLIDLYIMTITRLGSLELRKQEAADDDVAGPELSRINEYLDLLERQMRTPLGEREWGAFDELAEIAANFDLLLDVNEPEARNQKLSQTARVFGQLLRQQQPVGGMSGQVNQTLVRQFRMPGYPLVLISTDLLQEGEDLHTFCSSIHHYGISWTPSSMEQRIGRIDRVRSQSDRRLSQLAGDTLDGEDKLQVYFPHLEDTIEVLQVQRVLERMNVFLRLMHDGLLTTGREQRTVNSNQEFAKARQIVPQILDRLESAFPVRPDQLRGPRRRLAVASSLPEEISSRFDRLVNESFPEFEVSWEPQPAPGRHAGTAHLGGRVQPFALLLASVGPYPVVRCVSPIGCVGATEGQDAIVKSARRTPLKMGAVPSVEDRAFDLTVEGEVVLAATPETDAVRVGMLVRRVVSQADRLEQVHLPGIDEDLDTFREDLLREGDL